MQLRRPPVSRLPGWKLLNPLGIRRGPLGGIQVGNQVFHLPKRRWKPHLGDSGENMPEMIPDPSVAGRGLRRGGNLSMGRQELNPTTGKSRKFDSKRPAPSMPGDVN